LRAENITNAFSLTLLQNVIPLGWDTVALLHGGGCKYMYKDRISEVCWQYEWEALSKCQWETWSVPGRKWIYMAKGMIHMGMAAPWCLSRQGRQTSWQLVKGKFHEQLPQLRDCIVKLLCVMVQIGLPSPCCHFMQDTAEGYCQFIHEVSIYIYRYSRDQFT